MIVFKIILDIVLIITLGLYVKHYSEFSKAYNKYNKAVAINNDLLNEQNDILKKILGIREV